MADFGMNLRVTMDSKQGGRKYMEDVLAVKFQKTDDGRNIEYTYLAVFDGHGGAEAAKFAKEHLLEEVTKNKGFWSDDDEEVQRAIRDGFLSTHKLMWKAVGTWPKTLTGYPSTAGTTASVCFIRNGKMYVGHVGDSSIVMGVKEDEYTDDPTAYAITEDHKPDSPVELKRIRESGGQVVPKSGVPRVVWHRPKNNQGPVRRSTNVDNIPFLAIARALGDLWSYNSSTDQFVVSPDPDIYTHAIDLRKHKFLILASDGLWNMMKPQEAVDIVNELDPQSKDPYHGRKPASYLVHVALDRWSKRMLRADNTSVIVAYFDPPGSHKDSLFRQPSDLSTASTLKASDGEESMSDAELEEIFPSEDIDMGEDSHQVGSALMTPPPKPLGPENHGKPALKRLPAAKIVNTSSRPLSPRSAPAKVPVSRFFSQAQRRLKGSHSLPTSLGLSESAKRFNMVYKSDPHLNCNKLVDAEVVIDSENDPNKVSIISVTVSPSPAHKRPCSSSGGSTLPSKRPRLAVAESSQVTTDSPMPSGSGVRTRRHSGQGEKSACSPLKVDLSSSSAGTSSNVGDSEPMISPLWPSHLADDMDAASSADSVTAIKPGLSKGESIPRDVLQENLSTATKPAVQVQGKSCTPAKSTQGSQNKSPLTRATVKRLSGSPRYTIRQSRFTTHSKLHSVHRARVRRKSNTPKRS